MSKLNRCSRCVLPETHETIVFDSSGVCNICRNHEFKQEKINWTERKSDLDGIIQNYRGKGDYDCIVPYSGGKDSTWTLYYLVKEYKIKPLVVCFDHGFLRPNLLENTHKTMRKLGVDFHVFTPSWHVVQKLMLQAFLEKGDFCWHCHTGIFAYPMQVAIRTKTPLVIWGEPSSEYTAYYSYDQPEEVDEKRFNRYVNLGINADDMFIRLGGAVSERDLNPFRYPALKDLRNLGYRSICLGSFVPWDVKKQIQICKDELGWKGDKVENVPEQYDYEKIECYMQGVRDYIKFIKRGYTRPTHLTSLDIRNHRMSREEAMEIVRRNEGFRPPSLDLFLEYVGLTEGEFIQIAMSHQVSPYEHDPQMIQAGEKTCDFDQWPRYGGMDPQEAHKQIDRWKEVRSTE